MSLTRTVVLADKAACVPWPGKPGSVLPAEPFEVSAVDPFFAALLADGTLRKSKPPKPSKPNS
nr:hypothetical protein [Methylobacterium sp. ZNC0032]